MIEVWEDSRVTCHLSTVKASEEGSSVILSRPELMDDTHLHRVTPLCALTESVTAVTVVCQGQHTRGPSFLVNTHTSSSECALWNL